MPTNVPLVAPSSKGHSCPLWVKSRYFANAPCLLYPQQRHRLGRAAYLLGPKADSCSAAKRRTLFALNVCLADNATVFVVFATDVRGEIVEASANRIEAELEKLRCDLRRVDRNPKPPGELCDGVF